MSFHLCCLILESISDSLQGKKTSNITIPSLNNTIILVFFWTEKHKFDSARKSWPVEKSIHFTNILSFRIDWAHCSKFHHLSPHLQSWVISESNPTQCNILAKAQGLYLVNPSPPPTNQCTTYFHFLFLLYYGLSSVALRSGVDLTGYSSSLHFLQRRLHRVILLIGVQYSVSLFWFWYMPFIVVSLSSWMNACHLG